MSSLKDDVIRFAEEARAELMRQIEEKKQKDTKTVNWQGFDSDGKPVVKDEDQNKVAKGIGSTSQKANSRLIYDSAGSVEYPRRRRKEEAQPLQFADPVPVKFRKKKYSRQAVIDANVFEEAYKVIVNEPDGLQLDLTCIAVIDESGTIFNSDPWNTFRQNFPSRRVFLLQPLPSVGNLYVPPEFAGDPNATHVVVDRNPGTDDWFDICGLELRSSNSQILLFIDQSGSMTLNDVLGSYNTFKAKCDNAGFKVGVVDNVSEDWITPFYVSADYFRDPWTPEWI